MDVGLHGSRLLVSDFCVFTFDLFLAVDLIIDFLHAEMCGSVSQRGKQGKIEKETKMPY